MIAIEISSFFVGVVVTLACLMAFLLISAAITEARKQYLWSKHKDELMDIVLGKMKEKEKGEE